MRRNKLLLTFIISVMFLTAFTFAQPIITITDPADSSQVVGENVNLNYAVSEPILSCSFSLDGGAEDTSITIPNFVNLSNFIAGDDLDFPNTFVIEDDFLYVVHLEVGGGNKIVIYNVTDKSNPINVSSFVNATSLSDLAVLEVKDNIAYVGTLLNRFVVVNVTDKLNPVQLSSINDTSAFENPAKIVVSGNFAYIVNDAGQTVLTIVDITDKTNPVIVGTLLNTTFDGANGFYLTNDFAYTISFNSNTLKIINITDKTNPTQLSSFNNIALMNQPSDVDGDDNFAYVTNFVSNNMVIINVTDKLNPVSTGSFSNATLNSFINPSSLIFKNDFVYAVATGILISADGNTFAIIDVSDKTNPVLFSSLVSEEIIKNAKEIHVTDNFAYIRGSFSFPPITIINITSDTQNVILTPVAEGGHSLVLTCRDFTTITQDTSLFSVFIQIFPNEIVGKGQIFTIMRSAGAGTGILIQNMALSLPRLLIGIALVGIIASIGFAIALVIRRFNEGAVRRE